MPDQATVQSFLSKKDRSVAEIIVGWMLFPFAILYRVTVVMRRKLYRFGILKSVRLPKPVISVGGITAGGSGKTPVLIYLSRQLEKRGMKPLILTRGYGGESNSVEVIEGPEQIENRRLSDEVILMANRLSATIAVGADRIAAFETASESCEFDIVILDDGFQHLKIKRDADIVVLDCSNPFGSERLLPSGNLREPSSTLSDADLIIVTRISLCDDIEQTRRKIASRAGHERILLSDYVCDGVYNITMGGQVDPASLLGVPVYAFSAIAAPDTFFDTLRRDGYTLAGTKPFRDHHIFTQSDIDDIIAECRSLQCSAAIVTEKDAVKLRSLDNRKVELFEYRIRLQIQGDDSNLMRLIERVIDDSA